MPLEHKANVTSVTVLTEWGGEVSVISTTFHWASEAMTHICFSVSPSRSVQRVALLKKSLWRRMLQDQLGRSAENGNKRQSINCRASKPEKLSALSLCSFLSILILSSKTFSYQSIPSLFLQSDPFVRFHENRANGVIRLVLLTCLKGAVILQRAALHWWFGMRRRLYVCVGMAFIRDRAPMVQRTLLNLLRLLGTEHRWCEDPIESAPFIILIILLLLLLLLLQT